MEESKGSMLGEFVCNGCYGNVFEIRYRAKKIVSPKRGPSGKHISLHPVLVCSNCGMVYSNETMLFHGRFLNWYDEREI